MAPAKTKSVVHTHNADTEASDEEALMENGNNINGSSTIAISSTTSTSTLPMAMAMDYPIISKEINKDNKKKEKHHRFTVSPVQLHLPARAHTLLEEQEQLVRSDSQHSHDNLLVTNHNQNLLAVPGGSSFSTQGSPSFSSSGASKSSLDEGILDDFRRCRHLSSSGKSAVVSEAGTTETFLEDDNNADNNHNVLELANLTQEPHSCQHTSNILGMLAPSAEQLPESFIFDESFASHDDNTPQLTPLIEPPSPRPVPLIITSHPSDASLPQAVPDSLEVSRWDLNAPRNPNIQFYLGSCLSVASAGSSVSFFNTLYAHGYTPICRLCHQPASDKRPLTSPCNCVGSLRFVHHSCLMRWVDNRKRQLRRNPKCELCGYQFNAFRAWRSWKDIRLPAIPMRDRILHFLFIISVIMMAVCMGVIASVFRNNQSTKAGLPSESSGTTDTNESGMTQTEIITLTCGILFFVGFFLATLAQIKANWSIWKVCRMFWDGNYVLQLENDLAVDSAAKKSVLPSP